MYTKKILSAVAAAAVVSTGAMAFDTNTNGELLTTDSSTAVGLYEANLSAEANLTIQDIGPGQKGDALIFPAFFAGAPEGNDWQSEFSVINNSEHAVIAKVVLYGGQDSVELRDFNIYLSAHDVFRATLKGGKIHSEDGSTILPGSDSITVNEGNKVYNEDDTNTSLYKYVDSATMVSAANPLDLFVDPDEDPAVSGEGHAIDADGNPTFAHTGYIAVFAMAEADEAYHKKHLELWKDYRHLVDTCRSINDGNATTTGDRDKDVEWRSGITRGLYNQVSIATPNVLADRDGAYHDNCQQVYPSVLGDTSGSSAKVADRVDVNFSNPGDVLSGSILVSNPGTDGKGSRDLLLEAYALGNVTSTDANDSNFDLNETNSTEQVAVSGTVGGGQLLLWSEGEFAHIADRCITFQDKKYKNEDGETRWTGYAGYDEACIENDADVLKVARTYYEFRDNTQSQLLVTQPYKRVLLQRKKASVGRIRAWNNLTKTPIVNGEFRLGMKLYNDDEDNFTPVLGGFTVSPATTSTSSGVPYELAMFDPFSALNDADKVKYARGYSIISFKNGTYAGLSSIVTQMAATKHDDGTAETNWIYPLTEK